MPQVQTAKGPVDTAVLGRTLMHEHLFVVSPELQVNYPGFGGWDEEVQMQAGAARLNALKAAGYDTLVDVTVMPMGRDVARIRRLAELTELNIIVATGLYAFDELPGPLSVPPADGEEDRLVELFAGDIENGTGDTGVCAAIIKVATDRPGITPGSERVLRAAAKAHRRTGAPITTHSRPRKRGGLDQQRIFAEEGVDLGRVIIGHSGDTSDVDYLEEVIDNGSYIGMDRFGIDWIPFEERVGIVVAMCERGHADRMVLSHDAQLFNDWGSPAFPRWHYLHLHEDVLPELRRQGVSDDQIDQMLIENPRTIFEAQEPY
jgi:phosphotriesterase-related protein